MIRRKTNSSSSDSGLPAWMITFADMVTLLMTFFIVLVSMASMTDIYKRKVALGSVSGTFGTGAPNLDDLTTVDVQDRVDPGPLNLFKDLSPVRERLWQEPDADLRFESNRFVQRLSMNADALFAPGSAELTDKGRGLLDKVRPVVVGSSYPLGLTGHAGEGLDEFGPDFLQRPQGAVDFSWELSLARVMAVYQYFLESGIDAQKLRVEAFGRFRPRVGTEVRDGRQSNRRVEITLDRRIGSWGHETAAEDASPEGDEEKTGDGFSVKDFLFRFDLPGDR